MFVLLYITMLWCLNSFIVFKTTDLIWLNDWLFISLTPTFLSTLCYSVNKCKATNKSVWTTASWKRARWPSTHLKNLEQRLHVEAADTEGQTENGRNDDEDQEQCEPDSERDAQQHAQQIIERRHKRAHFYKMKKWFVFRKKINQLGKESGHPKRQLSLALLGSKSPEHEVEWVHKEDRWHYKVFHFHWRMTGWSKHIILHVALPRGDLLCI